MADPLADVSISDDDDDDDINMSGSSDGSDDDDDISSDDDDDDYNSDIDDSYDAYGSYSHADDTSNRSGSSKDLETMMMMMLNNPMIKALHERKDDASSSKASSRGHIEEKKESKAPDEDDNAHHAPPVATVTATTPVKPDEASPSDLEASAMAAIAAIRKKTAAMGAPTPSRDSATTASSSSKQAPKRDSEDIISDDDNNNDDDARHAVTIPTARTNGSRSTRATARATAKMSTIPTKTNVVNGTATTTPRNAAAAPSGEPQPPLRSTMPALAPKMQDDSLMYARDGDCAKLIEAYKNRHLRHLVMVVGQRGNGKTSLLKSLQPKVEQDDGYFVMGRYDAIDFPQPFAPLIETSKLYLQRLLEPGQEASLERVRKALARVMDMSEMQSLASVIPILADVMKLSSASNASKDNNGSLEMASKYTNPAKHLLSKYASSNSHNISNNTINKHKHGRSSFLVTYCNFIRAISHPDHPIVLVLDDCQAADPGSLEVLKILVADQKIQGLLCVVAFRPVGVRHPFSMFLRNLESAGVKFAPILPSAIPATSILEWMNNREELQEYPNLPEWSEQIQKGTKGNALSIHLCLQLLERHKDIFMPDDDDSSHAITATPLKVGGEVHQLFDLSFMMLSHSCQKLLQMASCMGMKIDEQRLKKVYQSSSSSVIFLKSLQEAKEAGIICKIKQDSSRNITRTTSTVTTRYEFSNAAYKDCIYQSMSDDDRAKYHTSVGNLFLQDVDDVGIYRALAHLRHSRNQLSPQGKEEFARLCLQAGLDTSGWTEFISAINYLDLGIELLDIKQKWRQQYELSLALYSASADVYNSSGNFDRMDDRLVEILENAKNASDKLQAYTIEMRSLSGRTMYGDAISLGLNVLPKLGEQIFATNRRSKNVLESELKTVRKLIDPLQDADILSLKMMADPKKAGAMTILNLLLSSCFIAQGELVSLIACRMVTLTVRNGLTDVSAVGFATLGSQLCAQGDITKGIWCSEVAIQMMEQFDEQAWKGRVMAIHWGILGRYYKPWKQCQEPLKIAYRLCMEAGDNEFALTSPLLSVFNMFVAGGALSNVAAAMKSVYQLLHKKNQVILMRILRPFFQTVLNLMGATTETNPLVLSGSIMNEEEEFKYAKSHSSKKVLFSLYLCQAEMAFMLHKFTRAQAALDKVKELSGTEMIFSSLSIKVYFLDAMVSIAMAWDAHRDDDMSQRDFNKRKKYYVSKAKEQLQKLEILAQHSPTTVLPKVYIIQAELRSMESTIEAGMDIFKRAMDYAEETGNMNDRTLACERAGLALRSCGKEDDALDYLEDCCAYYREWGAIVKVNHVKGNVIPQAIFEW
eukprot:CAMPEP_0119555400 /NCGR_PEP_ID=MMETSP1352-20130426/7630_1 /TAXON_ID=265584 /ORGANISM="Stauroneis constricta, Strain CCMP1120" /LENGTH=1324 /DNA_ID=CAMNT_0007602155 /DNA_START=53 /DNA_END=4024 /DNA_ORIENTATION=+